MKLIFATGLLFALYSCSRDSNYAPFSGYVQYIYQDTSNLPADDSTIFSITIVANGAQDSSYFTPTFPAAGGKILNTDASGNVYILHDTATVQIQVSQAPGIYLLSIQYETNKLSLNQVNILTRPAMPDTLYVEAASAVIDTGALSSVAFTVVPKRSHGLVSTGFSVNGRAYQLNGADTVNVSDFTGLANNVVTNGQMSITYVPGPSIKTLPPPVYVEFYSTNQRGLPIQTTYPLGFK
jgi:hypothetical protein